MDKRNKALLAMILQSLIIGFSFFAVKTSLKSVDTMGFLAHRFTITTICVVIYSLFNIEKFRVDKRGWMEIAPYSLGFPIMFFLFQTLGLEIITSSESGIIYAITPILTFIASKFLLNETSNAKQTLYMILSVLGVVFINAMKGLNFGYNSLLGVFFTLVSASSFAMYNVYIRKISKKYNPYQIAKVVIICGFIAFNIVYFGKLMRSGNIEMYLQPFSSVEFLISILFLSVLSSFLTIILTNFALANLDATTVSLFQNVSTVVSILAGVIFLSEKLYYYHYIGIIAILIGTIGFTLSKKAN